MPKNIYVGLLLFREEMHDSTEYYPIRVWSVDMECREKQVWIKN